MSQGACGGMRWYLHLNRIGRGPRKRRRAVQKLHSAWWTLRRVAVVFLITASFSGVGIIATAQIASADTGGYPYATAGCSDTTTVHNGVTYCAGDNWSGPSGLYDPTYGGYGYRNCTDWVAYRLATNNGYSMPRAIGDASAWGSYFEDHGVTVNDLPAVGAIAWESGGDHVAYVESYSSTTVTISEYNEGYYGSFTDGDGLYDTRTVPISTFEYIHVKDLSGSGGSAPSNGSYVSYNGNGYAIAGGAPLYVSNWASVGNPSVTPITSAQWSELNAVPVDGTWLSAPGVGTFIVAGGAPTYVSNYANVGGAQAAVTIDPWDIQNPTNPLAHLNSVPANGTWLSAPGVGTFIVAGGAPTYVSNYANVGGAQAAVTVDPWDIQNPTNPLAHLNSVPTNGTWLSASGTGIFIVAGGAPMYVSNFANVGGAQAAVTIDPWDIQNPTNPLAHLNSVPANGTWLSATGVGTFIVAGGAPMYVSNYANVGGAQPAVTIDPWDIQNDANPLAHLNSVPSNGTWLSAPGTGIFIVAGGAPMYVSNFANVGGAQSAVTVDAWDIQNPTNPLAHLNGVPANGTFVATLAPSDIYEIVGGAPLAVTDCSLLGDCLPNTVIDAWDIENIGNALSNLNAVPSNGATVEGLPSQSYWTFEDGRLIPTSAVATAVKVNDGSLSSFPTDSSPIITSAASAQFLVGTSGTFSVSASASPTATYSESGKLPSGVSFSVGGMLAGTPAAGTAGTYPLTITASNGVGTPAVQDFTLNVDQAPAITSLNGTTFMKGAASSFTPVATGFPAPTFTETGSLPTGVTFSSGVLSGTPTVAGTFPITLTASNGIGTNATQAFTLTVAAISITTSSLPTGSVYSKSHKVTYSATLAASGGNPPYKWSLASGSTPLPPGLKLSSAGVISGKAAAAGVYPFTVQVVDTKTKKTKTTPSAQNTATKSLSISVSS
jgi:surface antigen